MSADDLIAKLSAPAPEARPANAAPPAPVLLCTGCILDAKQLALRGTPPAEIPEPKPAVVLIQGMGLCEDRHSINVGTPSLLVAQPGQMPGGLG